MLKKFRLLPYLVLGVPLISSAQTIMTLGDKAMTIIDDYVIPIIFAIAFIYFILGVLKYVRSGGDEGARTEARSMMLYGIIALFVMSAVWGLVQVLADTTGIETGEGGRNIIPDRPE